MCAVGEHIHRREALGAVAFLGQEREIAGHRLGVAADVDDALRGHAGHTLDEGGRRTLPGRVHEDDVGLLARVGGFPYPCGGVSGKETGVFYAVVLCVADGVPDGVPVHFHAHNLPGLIGGRQADGADAAVGVEDDFFAGEVGGIDGQPVEYGGLDGVHLIEAAGAEGVGLAAEGVEDEALAVEDFFVLAQNDAGAAGIVVLYDGGDGDVPLFGLGQQGFHEVLRAGQHGLGRDQHHHHLTGGDAPAEQAVAEQAGAFVLVEGLVAAGVGGGADGQHHLIQHFILQKAALHRQHLVGAGRVDAGGEFSTGGGGKGGNDLVAVVVGRFHPPDGGDRAVFAQQGADVGLFLFELCGVFGGQHRAAAAVFGAKFAIHYHILLKPDRRVHCLTDGSAFSSSTS